MTSSQQIKDRLDIVDIISESVSLRKAGRRFTGFCPFHHNTRTPSFFVFPETQTWHCFGACAEGGDVFSYVQKRENMDFKESLKYLAEKAGVELKTFAPKNKQLVERENRLLDLMDVAADYYHQLFLYAPQAAYVRKYVAERGFTEETTATFKFGFALKSWDAARSHFLSQGYTTADLINIGLLTTNEEKGTTYDRFRNRLMIPIRDLKGHTVGFGARTLEKDGIPKYLNSPQTVLFDKSSILFGLDMCKRQIREARQAVIVEGYMDVIQAWQAGHHNVIAQMGTALTEAQLNQLKRFTKQFIIALDADAAGANATLRSLSVARQTLDRDFEVRFDARGLVRHEGRLKADIRVMTLPVGSDPDDILRRTPERWPVLVDEAKPVVAYVIEVLSAEIDLNNPKQKSNIARQIVPLIGDIPDAVERNHYWQLLARTLQIDEKALRQFAATPGKRKRKPAQKQAKQEQKNGSAEQYIRHTYFLQQCLHHPHLIRQVNDWLQKNQQPTISAQDFPTPEDQAIWKQLDLSVSKGQFASLDSLCDSLDTVLQERVQTIIAKYKAQDEAGERQFDGLTRAIIDWRADKIKQLSTKIKLLLSEATQNDEGITYEIGKQQQQLLVQRIGISKAKHALSAMSRRKAEDDLNS